MKIIVSGGDSFTYGAELPDDTHGPSSFSWANLVSKKFGDDIKHINTAASGRSNAFITRRVLSNVIHNLKFNKIDPKDIFVQIMWTFVSRREFKLVHGTLWDNPLYKIDSEWLAVDPYIMEDESKSDWFKKVKPTATNYEGVKKSLSNKYKLYKDAGIVDFGKAWYSIISDEDNIYNNLKDIILLQEFFKNNNIKYLFTYVGHHIPSQLFHQQYEHNPYITYFRESIDKDTWFRFPGDWDVCDDYLGFNDWALINNYEFATSHPLEKAHEDAAELIYEHIEKIL